MLVFESVQPATKEASVVLMQAGGVSVIVEGAQAVFCELNGLDDLGPLETPEELVAVRIHVRPVPVPTAPVEMVTPPFAYCAAGTGIVAPLQTRLAELILVPLQVTVAEVPRLSIQTGATVTKFTTGMLADERQMFAAAPAKQP